MSRGRKQKELPTVDEEDVTDQTQLSPTKVPKKTRGKPVSPPIEDDVSNQSDDVIAKRIDKLTKIVETLQTTVSTLVTKQTPQQPRRPNTKKTTTIAKSLFYHDHKDEPEVIEELERRGVAKIEKEKREKHGLVEKTITTSSYSWHDVKKVTDSMYNDASEDTKTKYIEEAKKSKK